MITHLHKHLQRLGMLAILAGTLASCESTTTPLPVTKVVDTTIVTKQDRALFVVNEGNFGKTNSTLDLVLFHKTFTIHDSATRSDTTIKSDTIIQSKILDKMGQGNDLLVVGNRLYVLDNGSNTLHVLDADSLRQITTISFGLDAPNKMALIGNNQMLVTRRMTTSAAIVDLTSNTIVDSIPFGEPSVAVAVLNNNAYVTTGGYTPPGHLNVINLTTRKLIKQYTLANTPEQTIADSANNQIIIGTAGDYATIAPHFYFVNAATNVLTDSLIVGDPTSDGELTLAGPKVFMIVGKDVYRMGGPVHQLPASILHGSSPFYKGYYDAWKDELYLGIYDFTSGTGKVEVYDAASFSKKWSFTTGIAPAHFAFYH